MKKQLSQKAWTIRASNWTIATLRRVVAATTQEYHEELFERGETPY